MYDAIITRFTRLAEVGCTSAKKLKIIFDAIRKLGIQLPYIDDDTKSGESESDRNHRDDTKGVEDDGPPVRACALGQSTNIVYLIILVNKIEVLFAVLL
ncbi:hypothetical protein Scep_009421 [Stephania cephalantha]|uniref:Uncharacterized protein n=1 Tax=Stephania cephalantha TaxID=152367 RepID=A0AAP0JVI0_9MAGN